nr:RNA-directed DNA polymerase, eukaryota [Tanacetum cinerariifolium]
MSNEDHTQRISHSIFVTNFPDNITSRDLGRECNVYGTVVDVFIPLKKSQAGKRFAFVRFIKVFNLDRLVKNLCTIWIGRHHLFANKVRFERQHKPDPTPVNGKPNNFDKSRSGPGYRRSNDSSRSYVNAVNGTTSGSSISASPALVLDENCIVEKDFTKHAMRRVKDASSISNLQVILHDEGFVDVKLKYLGGLWVMLEFEKEETKANLMTHTGANSWFQIIHEVIHDFVSDERIVWVDIEGVPLNAWTSETFSRIGKKWGETLNIEDQIAHSYSRKRVCILTKSLVSILESFKIIVKGKVFMVRAKELFIWNPCFSVNKEAASSSDDESIHGERFNDDNLSFASEEEEGEFNASNAEGVAETVFGDNSISPECLNGVSSKSEDPFYIYDILNKKKSDEIPHVPSPSLSHPPGFTPANLDSEKETVYNKGDAHGSLDNECSSRSNAKILNVSQQVQMEASIDSRGHNMNVLSINVQGLGNKTKKKWIKELAIKNNLNFLAIQETKMEKISHMDVKLMWDLWDYFSVLLGRWNGETILMGDFNEVRSRYERRGSWFSASGARNFNHFISSLGLIDVKLKGASFTWSHPSATKMSKLDRFLISDGVVSLFPSISSLCLDRHLSDHRPILLHEVHLDFGPIPFQFYHSWFDYDGFDKMVEQTWRPFSHSDRNGMICFKKKLQDLKIFIRNWINDKRLHLNRSKKAIHDELIVIDKDLDYGLVIDTKLKSKIRWAIEGDENSSFFHRIINKRISQLAIRGIFVNGVWQTDPITVKEAFLNHFEIRFKKPTGVGPKINFSFPKRLTHDQAIDLEHSISRDEIRTAVWNCGDNKSPGLDGFTFEFFKKYWGFIGPDFCEASAFISDRQILDGPFIINEILDWCKRKCKKSMFFKVDFAKAYDSVRWDYLLDVLTAFGFSSKWCQWIQGIRLNSSISVSHLFYADDALILGEWSNDNLRASSIGCSIMKNQFWYLGVMAGENMARHKAWSDVILKL